MGFFAKRKDNRTHILMANLYQRLYLYLIFIILAILPYNVMAKTKLIIFPFQLVDGELTPEQISGSTEKLVNELKQDKNLITLVVKTNDGSGKAKSTGKASSAAERIKQAENYLDKARLLADKRIYAKAIKLMTKAEKLYLKSIFFIKDITPLKKLYAEKALAYLKRGKDKRASKSLGQLLRLDYQANLLLGEVPEKLYLLFDREKQRLFKMKKGTISINSDPPGATVILNGRELSRTPAKLRYLLPGLHYLKVSKPGYPPRTRKVRIKGGSHKKFKESFRKKSKGDDPTGNIIENIQANKFNYSMIRNVNKLGKKLRGQYMLMAGLKKENTFILVQAFLVKIDKKLAYKLTPIKFDLELISGDLEAYNLIQEIGTTIESPPKSIQLPLSFFKGAADTKVKSEFVDIDAGPPPSERRIARAPAAPAPEKQKSKMNKSAGVIGTTAAPSGPSRGVVMPSAGKDDLEPEVLEEITEDKKIAPIEKKKMAKKQGRSKKIAKIRNKYSRRGPAKVKTKKKTVPNLGKRGPAIKEVALAEEPLVEKIDMVDIKLVTLEEEEGRKWYKKWWVWTIAGSVLVTGGTTIYLLSGSDSGSNVQATFNWNTGTTIPATP